MMMRRYIDRTVNVAIAVFIAGLVLFAVATEILKFAALMKWVIG